jgi:YD repeat-containing protein
MFGLRWTSNFEESVFPGGDGFMKYLRADGGIWSFGFTSGRLYSVVGPANKTATLTQGPVNWTLAFENGEQRAFDLTTGKLLSITDRNGNTTTLTYDASYRVATVTDPASRHLYLLTPALEASWSPAFPPISESRCRIPTIKRVA